MPLPTACWRRQTGQESTLFDGKGSNSSIQGTLPRIVPQKSTFSLNPGQRLLDEAHTTLFDAFIDVSTR